MIVLSIVMACFSILSALAALGIAICKLITACCKAASGKK